MKTILVTAPKTLAMLSVLVTLVAVNARAEAQEAVMSASMKRYASQWKQTEPRSNEFYTSFRYSPAHGLGYEEGISRRDPSTIIRVDGEYYVYYTRTAKGVPVVGYDAADDAKAATTWDLASIYFATSMDGQQWAEQGRAVTLGPRGSFDDRSVFTPDILVHGGKYYLFYQAVKSPYKRRSKNVIAMSWAESPRGPWHRWPEPILTPGEPGEWDGDEDDRSRIRRLGAFDSLKVHDPNLIVRDGRFWLYYKAHPMGVGGSTWKPYPDFSMGVAIAEKPEGPYRKSPLSPVSCSGHEVVVWPYKEGVAALITANGPEKNTIQWAADGLNFDVMAHVVLPPDAAGAYRPDAYANTTNGQGITWGLSHVAQRSDKPWPYLIRFDCNLTGKPMKGSFKRENIRFSGELLLEATNPR